MSSKACERFMASSTALEVYIEFARKFKLGKQAENSIGKLTEAARQINKATKRKKV